MSDLFVGIDLSAQPRGTALCEATYDASRKRFEVGELQIRLEDDDLITAAASARGVGIDAPFGWPTTFVAAMAAYADDANPTWASPNERYDYSALRLRHTDREVTRWKKAASIEVRCHPMSVSSDSIGVVAFRAARLLVALSKNNAAGWQFDRTGGDPAHPLRVFEVYPAATLAFLGVRKFDTGTRKETSYKGNDGRQQRQQHLCGLRDALENRFEIALELGDAKESALETDHAFDAVVSAVTALLAHLGETRLPSDEEIPDGPNRGEPEREVAQREGWIHVPCRHAPPGSEQER